MVFFQLLGHNRSALRRAFGAAAGLVESELQNAYKVGAVDFGSRCNSNHYYHIHNINKNFDRPVQTIDAHITNKSKSHQPASLMIKISLQIT